MIWIPDQRLCYTYMPHDNILEVCTYYSISRAPHATQGVLTKACLTIQATRTTAIHSDKILTLNMVDNLMGRDSDNESSWRVGIMIDEIFSIKIPWGCPGGQGISL